MTLTEAIEGISDNLSIVIVKLLDLEESENLSASDMVSLQAIKERMVGCSNLILSISENRESLHKDYIVYEIKVAQKFCKKSITQLNDIEERCKLF